MIKADTRGAVDRGEGGFVLGFVPTRVGFEFMGSTRSHRKHGRRSIDLFYPPRLSFIWRRGARGVDSSSHTASLSHFAAFSATATEPCPYASVWPASATSVTWLSRPSNSQAVVQVSTTTATIDPPPLPSVDAAPPSYVPAIITSYASATVCPQAPSSTRLPPQISSATSLRLSASTNSHAASSTAAAAATIQDHPRAFSAAASLSLLAAAATVQLVMCLNACISILVKVYPLYRMMQCRL
ncbi:hypothetical protein BHE74_00038329 [Ensete ventricosum]|nr:hypothetical protein BHE74_00038329 [Ensete ventricosum]